MNVKLKYCNCEPKAVCGRRKFHPTEINSILNGKPIISKCQDCKKEMSNNNEQKLVDLCFDIALTISSKQYIETFQSMTTDQKASWIAKQLSDNGFKTVPCGSSYGILKP